MKINFRGEMIDVETVIVAFSETKYRKSLTFVHFAGNNRPTFCFLKSISSCGQFVLAVILATLMNTA